MATVKMVCGDCGAPVSEGDKFCPQCGVRIDRPASTESNGRLSPPEATHCVVCGNNVSNEAAFCESCGAALKNASVHSRKPSNVSKVPKKGGGGQGSSKGKGRRTASFEPWQVIVGIVVVGLVGFFAYTELSRAPVSPISAPPEMFPAQAAVSMQDIDRLQETVDANPDDDVSLLRLANMLQDASRSNSTLLMRAVDTYAKYLKLKPNDPNARVDMGICYFEMARTDSNNAASLIAKSIQEMKAALDANPTHQPAAFNLGIVNLNAGNLEESNKWFRRTVELNPNSDLGKKAQQMIEQHSLSGQSN
jgi:cytochrome c-type biogenesis protein CcmH/NrfG